MAAGPSSVAPSRDGMAAALTVQDTQFLQAVAVAAGFEKLGVTAAPPPGSAEDVRQQERFARWVAEGRAGEMAWLTRRDGDGQMLRSSLHRAVPWARSVLLCAKVYNAPAPYSIEPAPAGTGWIARYAWSGDAGAGSAMGEPAGLDPAALDSAALDAAAQEPGTQPAEAAHMRGTDYHDVMLGGLRQIEAELRRRFGGDLQTRCYVDTGPVVERHLAQLAGIGWVGKNTCILDQQLGSWMLLGTILTSLPLAPEATLAPAADRCGSCTRCIDACPTDALVAPREMDASRCIAYLTIEKKGSIPEHLRAGMGRQVFGCDICQDVCPWNRRAPVGSDSAMQMRPELVNPSLEWLASLDAPGFKRVFKGSPLERTGRKRLQRNVAIAMGNSGDTAHRNTLLGWSASDDDTLREAAAWALARLGCDQGTAEDAAEVQTLC